MNYEDTAHAENQEPASTELLSEEEKKRWEKYDRWQDTVYAFENSSMYLFAICAGLAAPLLNLLNENRVIMNWHGGTKQQHLLIHLLTLIGMGKFAPIQEESQLIQSSRRTNPDSKEMRGLFGLHTERLCDEDLTRATRNDAPRVALVTGKCTLSHLATFEASELEPDNERLAVIDLNISLMDTATKEPPAPISELVKLLTTLDWAADWALLSTLLNDTKSVAGIRRHVRSCIDHEHQVWERHYAADSLSDTGYLEAGPKALAQLEAAMRFFSCVQGIALIAEASEVLPFDSSDIYSMVLDMRHAWINQPNRNLKD